MPKMSKITHNVFCKNVKNHATFVEGFWTKFYARGRFFKYSMSVFHCDVENIYLYLPGVLFGGSWVFFGCFMGDSRVLQECFKSTAM